MSWRGLRARLRSALLRRAAERDADEEMRFHLEMEIEENVRRGLSPREARRRALVAFGGVERHRERLREGRSVPVAEPLARDVGMALRAVRRDPVFALVAVATVSLGVGATTAVFSIANAFLLRSLPVPAAERLYTIQERRVGQASSGAEGSRVPYERYLAYREATTSVFSGLAAHRGTNFALRLSSETLSVDGALVSANYFDVLGVTPALGRFFSADDAPEVVLGHAFWSARMHADPAVIGTSVWLDGRPFTVVGVGPPGFAGTLVGSVADFWVAAVAAVEGDTRPWYAQWVGMFGALAAGVEPVTAEAAVRTVARTTRPLQSHTRVRDAYLDALTGVVGSVRTAVAAFTGMLLLMAILVLLIASANLAGMLGARAVTRRRELAVRLALGAGRGRVVQAQVVESLLLFLIGGGLGVAIAFGATAWLGRLPLPSGLEHSVDLTPDGRVLAFALLMTSGFGLAFSLLPALRVSRPGLLPALHDGGRGASAHGRGSRGFVTVQVATSVLLLLVATLAARSIQSGLTAEIGFDPRGLVVATTDLGPHGYDRESGRDFYRRLVARVRVLPGVESVALSQVRLLDGDVYGDDISSPDSNTGGVARGTARHAVVDPGFFGALRVPIVAGRGFAETDAEGSAPVTVVNETVAELLWPGESPLGKRLRRGSRDFEVIGVARNGKYVFIGEQPVAYTFRPFAQQYASRMSLHARAPGSMASVLRDIRAEVRALDPDVAVERAEPLANVVGFSLFPYRFTAQLVGVFGVAGLLLSALGIYGLLAFQVAGRTRELGVRRALGATGPDVVRQVVARGATVAAIGCGVGVALGAPASYVARSVMIGLGPLDPPTFVGVPLVLFTVALLASWLPARRAASVAPTEALREE